MDSNSVDRINNISLTILAGTAIAAVLIYTKTILIPFVFAIFMYFILTPIIEAIQSKTKLPRAVAIGITALAFILGLTLIVLAITSSLETFLQSAGIYKDKIISFIHDFTAKLQTMNLPISQETIMGKIQEIPFIGIAKNFTGGALNLFSNTLLIAIFTLFLIFGEQAQSKTPPLLEEIKKSISFYISSKLILSLVTGILTLILLASFGIELTMMFCILTVLLNFIPNIGSAIAVVLPIPVILLQYGLGWQFIVIMSLSGIIQFTIGNIIEPKLMGDSMDLHPVTILLFLTFWGLVWGLPGMFLSVPITATMKIILGKVETTKPIAELFAGRIN